MAGISAMNIAIGMDAGAAEKGFNRLGAMVEGFQADLTKATMIGSAFGTLIGNMATDSVRKVEGLAKSFATMRQEMEKADFTKLIEAGANPQDIINSKAFEESVFGGVAKAQSAWDEMVRVATDVFAPAVSGVFTGVASVVKATTEAFTEIMNPEKLGLQNMFENMYKITLDIAKVLVDAGQQVGKIFNNARLIANPTATGQAWDDFRKELPWWMGGLSRKAYNERLNNRLTKMPGADLKQIEAVQQAEEWINGLGERARTKLDELKVNPPKFNLDPEKLFGSIRNQANEMATVNPNSVFAPLMERGGMADWKQTQLQAGIANDVTLERFRESMRKQDQLINAVNGVRDAVNAKPGAQANGIVAIPR